MRRAAITKEADFICVRIEIESFNFVDSSRNEAMDDIGFKVEAGLSSRSVAKEASIVLISMSEPRFKLLVHLIGLLSDARTHRCVDILAPGAELLHGLDRRVCDPGKCAPPPPVGNAADDALVICE